MTETSRDLAEDLRSLITHLIRAALVVDDEQRAAERREALALHDLLLAHATPSATAAINLDGLWTQAVHRAETADLHDEPLRVSLQLSAVSPLALADLVQPGLALSDLEERIRNAAATG